MNTKAYSALILLFILSGIVVYTLVGVAVKNPPKPSVVNPSPPLSRIVNTPAAGPKIAEVTENLGQEKLATEPKVEKEITLASGKKITIQYPESMGDVSPEFLEQFVPQ